MKLCDIFERIGNTSATFFARLFPNTRKSTLVFVGLCTIFALITILMNMVFLLLSCLTGFSVIDFWIIAWASLGIYAIWHKIYEDWKGKE